MSLVTIEKGQHLKMLVEYVEEVPSKNPSWDSRWKLDGLADGGIGVSTYIGNKAMMQQLGRIGLDSPNKLVAQTFTFERTAEGYLNIIKPGGKVKTTHVSLEGEAPRQSRAAVMGSPAAMPFDAPTEEEVEQADAIRAAKRQRVREDIFWAFSEADSMVAAALANREVEYTVDALRSVVALAATLHISYKEVR